MQRWIASLTLLAYVIGGWALPAMHHHGVGTASALHGDIGCQAHGHASQAELGDHESHPASCSHSCKPSSPLDATEPVSRPSTGVGVRSSDVQDCHGLCALCVARSLCSQRLAESDVAVGIALIGGTFLVESRFVLQRARGNVSSRGPPLFV